MTKQLQTIMANHLRQSRNNITRVLLTFYIGTFLFSSTGRSPISCNAHLIHITDEHHEFRPSILGRPHLPPPLPPPPPPPSQLAHVPGRELTPAECMVDLTNDLAYRILHYHSILNRNNFAFSPTALMSVLVALYEGSTGRSATELKNVLQLPNNRDIIRVGYRDIHRRLRTYFFGSDNPLKGLSLNKENVTVTRDFEAILMFYGYDLGMDMVSSTTVAATMSTSMTTSSSEATTTTATTKKETEIPDTSTTTQATIIQETTITTVETTTTSPAPTTTTTPIPTTIMTTMETTTQPTTVDTTTPANRDSTEVSTETTVASTEPPTSTQDTSTSEDTTTESPTVPPTSAAINEAAEFISSFVAEENSEPLSRIQQARVTRLPNVKLQAPRFTKVPQANYLPSQRFSKRPTMNRKKRHIFGFTDFESNLFVSLLNGGGESSYLQNLAPATGWHSAPSAPYLQGSNEFDVDTDPNYINSPPSAAKQNYNTDVITHVFYLSSQQVIYTTYKVYNAVLYYKYFEHLRMSVLELELDTPDYNLIILLPDYNSDLVAAAAALRSGPKLRLMRKQLRPRWVQAIIPDFRLQGTMFLTNDLQNLGVYDIFEPNRADFRPMTEESGTYVKHIEQSINIHIRTHPINQIRRNAGAQAQPKQISVNHPFMFFVIDRDLDVAVMSGRVLNPLNVRIQ
ncbi:serpin 85F [Haematobia irritans]|uniref:serpin 85F n=1 Tax=Haematobia irritans TaxID=7368 RepID=UPI003F5057CA